MKDKVVIVTGGGRGIGRAICARFAQAGAQVIAAARTPAELDETCRLIQSRGGNCETCPTDIGSSDDIHALIQKTKVRFGRIDVLINNAGIAPQSVIEELDEALFDLIWSINVKATYLTSRAVWPIMRSQGGGVIINLSSIASVDPFPGFAAYGSAKTWVNSWTKALAEEGRPVGIRVLAVAPGAVETRMLRDPFPNFPKDQTLQPEDVANMVFTLAQPECRYATGQTVFVKK